MGHIEGIWRRLVVLQRATPRRSVQPRHVAVVVVRCDFKSDGLLLLLLLLLRRSAASPAAAPFLSEAEDGSRYLVVVVVVGFIVAANAAAVIWASMLWSRSISLSSAAEDEDGEQND